ncbi:Coiled-coil domain-containing protein [Toxocara canis]|uniref:Coiled-coil domain-containing protein n=1 Tax=Toxocara canis TaxID=6265 RepID=A0A0B2UT80_TOXCA|nr:Coiled-coil domain-containing protein [Toxocara canis]
MPKKFTGENSKAVAARSRKEAAKKVEAEKKKQEEEDAYWRDDDKGALRKQQRKEEQERKREEALRRRQENRLAHDEELNSLAGKASSSIKVTQAAIEATKRLEEERRKEEERERLLKEKKVESESDLLEENVNRLEVEGESARSVSEAIKVLSTDSPVVDRHPEKRLKAAYLVCLKFLFTLNASLVGVLNRGCFLSFTRMSRIDRKAQPDFVRGVMN